MITLKEVKWGNCFSYGPNNYVKLNENTITQIVGPNGVGKSSIPLILEEAFFSKNSKGVKKGDIPNRNSDSDAYNINVTFDIDGEEYELDVVRKSTIKVKLLHNGADISSHTATNTFKTVADLLGFDFKTMSQLFYQNTNASLQFLTATDTNRKKFLIDLLSLEEYVELFEIFKEAVREVSLKVSGAESAVSTITKWMNTNKLEATDVLALEQIDLDTAEDEVALHKLISEIKNISEKNRKISINNDNKKRLSEIDISSAKNLDVCEHINYDSETSAIGAAKSQVSTLTTYISKIERLKGKCPTCEQNISEEFKASLLQDARVNVTDLIASISELEARVKEIKTNNALYANKVATMKLWEDTYRSIDNSLSSDLIDKSDYDSKITELQKRVSETKAEIARLTNINNERIKANTRRQVIEEQYAKFAEQLKEATEILDKEANVLSNLEILKKSFSTNGLIAYKIENLVKDLEDLTNDYLAELSDGRFTIEFVVSNDKLNVEITDFGKPVDILSLSSGELARVNTSTLLALRKLMNSISKSTLNVLFLDEVINVLDEQGKEKLIEVLLQEDLNIFIVSHNWTHPLLAKLEIAKDENGMSYIER